MDIKNLSKIEVLAQLPPEARTEFLADLTPEELDDFEKDWRIWARPDQLPPGPECPCCNGNWIIWLLLAGRGYGKTRTGAEWVHASTAIYGRFHLVGATASDVRDVIVEGESGLLATQKRQNKVKYSPTKRRLDWENGAMALCFSGEEPERLRGPQCEAAWCDELAAWEYEETWSQLQLGLRLGPKPRTVITTTPKPTRLIKRLVKDMDRPLGKRQTHVTTGSSFANISNLSETFINEITSAYDGTRFGRQEIYAEILDDAETALWNRQLLEDTRIQQDEVPRMKRIVIGVDPAVSFGQENAETGIVVCGMGMNGHIYVLHDASGRYRPEQWARKVGSLYQSYSADRIVAEKNMGGDLVEHTLKVEDSNLPVKLVHASKNKIPRAEPVSTMWEKGNGHMVGFWQQLESQMCTYEAGSQESPDRMDAMVWGMTELIGKSYSISVNAMIENELVGEKSRWRI